VATPDQDGRPVIGRAARRRLLGLLAAAALLALVFASSAPAHVVAARECGNVRVDRTLKPAPLGIFGAFGIKASGTGCAKARKVASAYIHDPGAIERKSARIRGYRCTFRANGVQQGRVTCTRHHASVGFLDLIPNG
jgi:hypothetical protein